MTDIYAVAGRPVSHSLSPAMFNAAFREMSIDAVYTRLAAFDGRDIIDTARSMGIRGLNITSPFKEAVIPFLDELDGNARSIGSVNTVVCEDGKFKGYNTDHMGVRDGLAHSAIPMEGKHAVVLGASGAGRAAVFALLSSGAGVTLVNRSFPRAREWAEALGCEATPVEALGDAVRKADILVSCVTTSQRIVPPSSLQPGLTVFDANYSHETALRKDARDAGCRLIDGRLWLLFQALPAFRIMTGRDAPLEAMRLALFHETPQHKTNIGLIGFMGTGKSTAAAGVAARLGLPFVDTDTVIEEKTGLLIRDIFARSGEEGFRAMEQGEVDRASRMSRAVISFGGGAVMRRTNREAMTAHCVMVWLWASPETIRLRTGHDRTRPLICGDNRTASIPALLSSRLPLYARASDLIVNTDRATPEETVERICHEIDTSL